MPTAGYFSPIVLNDQYVIAIYPEASGQSFNPGELVFLNANGQVTACTSDAALILGRALSPASGVANANLSVQVFLPGVELVLNTTNGGSDVVLAASHFGTNYGLYVSGGQYYVDFGDMATLRFCAVRAVGGPNSIVGITNSPIVTNPLIHTLQVNSTAGENSGAYVWTITNVLTVTTNSSHQLRCTVGGGVTIQKVIADVKTAPTGADLIVDINIGGTSIWNVTPANRVKIVATNTTGSQTSFDTVAIVEDDLLDIDIDQIGSTVAGADLTVTLKVRLKR